MSDEVKSILNAAEKDESTGPAILEAVSSRLIKILTTPLEKENYNKLKAKLLIPENCKQLAVPKMNPDLWGHLTMQAKSSEAKMQQAQQVYAKGMVSFALIADTVSKNSKLIPQGLQRLY